MAGMFCSLQEAAAKLNKTEEDVKQLAKDGKLREFRDGPNLLFKIDEVEALMTETGVTEAVSITPEQPTGPLETAELEQTSGTERPTEPAEAAEQEQVSEPELPTEPVEAAEMERVSEPELPTEPVEAAEMEQVSEPELPTEPVEAAEMEQVSEPELPTEPVEASESEQPSELEQPFDLELPEEPQLEPTAEEPEEEEISLAPETGAHAFETDLTDVDTALTGEGISVLGETDRDYKLTDDTMAETIGPSGTKDKDEASLEEIEEDVNLDSFGSGSGLLDLSLQADDTSLGGILDEIYTTECGEEGQEQAEPSAELEPVAEAEPMLVEEELAGPEPAPQISPVATAYVESAPDVQSNTFGMLLFLPLLVLLYTAIVTVAAQRGVIPSILKMVQGLIWPIMIGAVVATGLVVGAAFVLGGTTVKGPKKAKKPKKPKKPKKSKKAKKTESSAPENETA